jgi:hypothetical protein
MRGSSNLLFLFSCLIFASSIFSFYSVFQDARDFSFTGYAITNATGQVNFTINESASIDFLVYEINWGNGSVDSGSDSATLDSEGGIINGSWDVVTEGFLVRNSGNVNLVLNLTSGKDAASFVGGTGPSYMYKISNENEGACVPPAGFNLDQYYEIGSSNLICDSFVSNRNISIDLRLVVPTDSFGGALSDTITLVYESV